MESFAQMIGYLGLTLGIISFQQNKHKRIIFFQLLASCVFFIHFALIKAYTGAALNAIGVLRAIIFYNRGKRWADSKIWVAVISVLCLAMWPVTWITMSLSIKDGLLGLLPATAMVLTTFSFYINKPKLVRRISFPSSPLWMIYNFINGSNAGVLTEAFLMTSIIVGMIRFDRKKTELEVVAAE